MTAIEASWEHDRLTILATLTRRFRDLALAEDAVQDAFLEAAKRWPLDGVPQNPRAWLRVAATRKAIDIARRDARFTGSDELVDRAVADAAEDALDADPFADDRLGLMFACAHPSLAPDVRLALTLRHVAGLAVESIARALLLTESALQKRLVRARAKIREAGISFELPPESRIGERFDDVRRVIYLIFNEGYFRSDPSGTVDVDLCETAIALARALLAFRPADNESRGLLALLRLHHARFAARVDANGGAVRFADQDRRKWDQAAIDEARALLALTGSTVPGRFQLEAAIALVSVASPAAAAPWKTIARLYAILAARTSSPVVGLNYAYALLRSGDLQEARRQLDAAVAALPADRYPLALTLAQEIERAFDFQRNPKGSSWRPVIH